MAKTKRSMTLDEFKDQVDDGQIFSVSFVKKTTGEVRNMVARRGVKKGVKGVVKNRREEDEIHNVLTVYDMQKIVPGQDEKGAFRRINLEGLISVTLHRKVWNWDFKTGKFTLAS